MPSYRGHGKLLLTGLLAFFFLNKVYNTYLGLASPTMGWFLPHQLLIKPTHQKLAHKPIQ